MECKHNFCEDKLELKKIGDISQEDSQDYYSSLYETIAITGDIHGTDFRRIKKAKKLGIDTLIVCGDFGYVWNNLKENEYNLRIIDNIGVKVLFLDGNHENFDELERYPYKNMFGGKVQVLRKNIIHLLRGEIYKINNKKVFVMGGAISSDKEFRIKGKSWWEQEVPNKRERQNAMLNLKDCNNEVDIILTHTAPTSIIKQINIEYGDEYTDFLEGINGGTKFKHWYFGHMHINRKIDDKHTCIYTDFIEF